MKIGHAFSFPEEQKQLRQKTKRLSWLSIVLLISAGILIYLALGQSQAMKTAWISDILTAVPPMALLWAMRHELREPTKRFPYGYTRSISIAFLVTSAVLSIVGLYLMYDSLLKLVHGERPPIGTMELFGRQFWAGWAMIAALAWSMSCGLTLGLLKRPVAKKLHDKALDAEATMNRAEWMSEGAAILGILLVGFGHWWGDAAAAAFISFEIVHDGWLNMRLVVADLMDETPTKMGGHDLEDLGSRIRTAVQELAGVTSAAVRLREHGRALTGEVYVELRDGADVVERVAAVATRARGVDWRLRDITVMPVGTLLRQDPPKAGG